MKPPPSKVDSTSSGTIDYRPPQQPKPAASENSQLGSQVVNESDRTVISQRPVAAPEEFYRSMPLSELASILEGRHLDHFTVEQMIGGGGMGAVFRGRDQRLDRVVAIKVIPAAKRDPETLRRFRLEAQAAAKLDHPNIARVYYVGEADQWNYIVFEFIDGVNIRDLVEMEGPLSVDDAVYYTRQVAEALQHAHERDVVHRDIKPSNVLVTATGSAKVVDMGLARNTALDKSTEDETASGVTLGTFDYISPEQARDPRDADVRSDLYSLGCTLFYMLTGHPPFPQGTALQKLLNHGSQPPPDPRAWREDLSDQLFEITMKLMAKRPSDRYQNPAELISDLAMLAELEDLQRSQSPGTLLVSPHIAQRSLIETNLPWMVGVAFLLGSTLWLQSVQTLSNDFTIAELEFKPKETVAGMDASSTGIAAPSDASTQKRPFDVNPSAIDGNALSPLAEPGRELPTIAPTTSTELINSPQGTGQLGSLPSGPLVVSTEWQTDVDPRVWESSLSDALRRVSQFGLQEIEIRGRQVVSEPLSIQGQELRIRGGPDGSALIEVSEEALVLGSDDLSIFDVRDSILRLEAIALDVKPRPGSANSGRCLFSVSGRSQLELDNCTITVKDSISANSYRVVVCDDRLSSLSARTQSRLSSLSETPSAGESIMIQATTSVVRGEATFIALNFADALNNRVDISLSDTLLALSGSVLEISAPTGDAISQRFVRLLCDQSTFVTEQPFAKLEYVGGAAPLLGLIRTSQSCVYWSRPDVPHVLISGARRQSVLGNFNLLVLQGMNNLYDANIADICQSFLGSERIATFGFTEAYTTGWLAERGNEAVVRWQNASIPPLPLHEAQAQDFAVSDLLFVPGITPRKPGAFEY